MPRSRQHLPRPDAVAYPDHLRGRVDAYLETVVFSGLPGLAGLEEAMRYSLLAPGKRIRPVLALATAGALRADAATFLPLAAALELIHTYSLIHDDLPAMDDDDLRRGRPTCHVAFGENVAILAGDALYAEAFRHVLSAQTGPAERILRAVVELAAATGVDGMVGGQFLDVCGRADPGPDGLRTIHALKTGRLIAAAVECVLILMDVGPPERTHYARFAAELGVLFQIVDDILDVTGTDAALGKPSGSDERHGKRTYVSEYGLERARELAADSHAGARRSLEAAAPRRRRRAPPDHGLHLHPDLMTRTPLLDSLNLPSDLRRLSEEDLERVCPGGARAHHRHGRRDRRPLRRQPRHVRAGRGPALRPRLPSRQDPLGRRPPGLSAQDPHRARRTACPRSAPTAASRPSARSPSQSTTSWAPATPRPRSATPSGSRRACAGAASSAPDASSP